MSSEDVFCSRRSCGIRLANPNKRFYIWGHPYCWDDYLSRCDHEFPNVPKGTKDSLVFLTPVLWEDRRYPVVYPTPFPTRLQVIEARIKYLFACEVRLWRFWLALAFPYRFLGVKFEPRDQWIGRFYGDFGKIYICLVPCFPIIFQDIFKARLSVSAKSQSDQSRQRLHILFERLKHEIKGSFTWRNEKIESAHAVETGQTKAG